MVAGTVVVGDGARTVGHRPRGLWTTRSDIEATARIAAVLRQGAILSTEEVARDLAGHSAAAWRSMIQKRKGQLVARARRLLLSMSGESGIPIYSDEIVVADPTDPSGEKHVREVWAWYDVDVTLPGIRLGQIGVR